MSCLAKNIPCNDSRLQQLVDAVENAVSLSCVVVIAWQIGCRLTVLLIEQILDERAKRPTVWPTCPKCQTRLQSKGFAKRQVTTMVGVIHFKRRIGRCPNRCRIGLVAPLDLALELVPHQHSCVTLKRLACLLAVFVPYQTASSLLNELISMKVSAKSIFNWVQNAGHRAICTLNDELSALAQGTEIGVEPTDPDTENLPLLIGVDGVMAPFRPEKGSPKGARGLPSHPKGAIRWREVKVAIVARLGVRRSQSDNDSDNPQTQLIQRRLVACLGNIDDLGERLWLQALRSGIQTAGQVVFISDGARGFWRLFETYFAKYAIGILDFYHAVQHLGQAAKAWLDGRTTQARAWFVSARHRLRHGPTMSVRRDIEKALTKKDLGDCPRRVLSNLIDYLDTHQNHIQYHQFKAKGLPIGSGVVESACKWLIIQRFKGVGMRWSETGFNALLHLRLAWTNNRFDDLFSTTTVPD